MGTAWLCEMSLSSVIMWHKLNQSSLTCVHMYALTFVLPLSMDHEHISVCLSMILSLKKPLWITAEESRPRGHTKRLMIVCLTIPLSHLTISLTFHLIILTQDTVLILECQAQPISTCISWSVMDFLTQKKKILMFVTMIQLEHANNSNSFKISYYRTQITDIISYTVSISLKQSTSLVQCLPTKMFLSSFFYRNTHLCLATN